MRGNIIDLDTSKNCGRIRGEDGVDRDFDREHMVKYLQFLDLRPRSAVLFDVDKNGRVINVILSKPPLAK